MRACIHRRIAALRRWRVFGLRGRRLLLLRPAPPSAPWTARWFGRWGFSSPPGAAPARRCFPTPARPSMQLQPTLTPAAAAPASKHPTAAAAAGAPVFMALATSGSTAPAAASAASQSPPPPAQQQQRQEKPSVNGGGQQVAPSSTAAPTTAMAPPANTTPAPTAVLGPSAGAFAAPFPGAASSGLSTTADGSSPPSGAITEPDKASCLYFLTKIQPTNYDMLLFRTLNQDLGLPNHNNDYLAVKMRDELMPIRSWFIKHLPWVKYQMRSALESRVFGVPGCINFIDARTKWFDLAVTEATTWKNIRQVVIVAAGYDTRAYRLAQPGVTFYEVDLPSASVRKQKLVEKLKMVTPGGRRPVYVAADLSKVDLATALKGTGFDPSQPTLFTVEGLIYYLPEAAAHRLVASIGSLAAPGSPLYFDYMQLAALTGQAHKYPGFMVTAKAVANKGEPYLSGLDDSPEAVQQFVGLHGFRLQQHLSPKDIMAHMLPHVPWNDTLPPIASFYSYAAVVKE